MSLPETQQANTLIEKSERILLITPQQASLDAFASMVSLFLTLQSDKEEQVDEVNPNHVPTNLQFLPGSSQIMTEPSKQSEVIIDIPGPNNITAIRHKTLQEGHRVHITLPSHTALKKENLDVTIRPLPYDLVITFGTSDLEDLGTNFTHYTDFFYSTPIINIDHKANNEYYGTVNIVDITAGSVAEVTYDLITKLINNKIEPDIATALYTGIIAETESFQKPSTTPRSFQIAAKLMDLKADREAVIQHVVKTKPLSLLKLAGRMYARLRYNQHEQLFWSILRPSDFQESDASPSALPQAMYELTKNIAGFSAVFVLNEKKLQQYVIHLILGKGLNRRKQEIQKKLKASLNNDILELSISANSIESAEQIALEKIQSVLPNKHD